MNRRLGLASAFSLVVLCCFAGGVVYGLRSHAVKFSRMAAAYVAEFAEGSF